MDNSTTNVKPTTIGINNFGSIPSRRDSSGAAVSTVALVVGVDVGDTVVDGEDGGVLGTVVVRTGGHLFSPTPPSTTNSPSCETLAVVVVRVVCVRLLVVVDSVVLVRVSEVVVVVDVVEEVVVGAALATKKVIKNRDRILTALNRERPPHRPFAKDGRRCSLVSLVRNICAGTASSRP